jgi:glycosyltransferase involved in cell wall biosynthesis
MSRIALVTRARAPYHKALQEAFAQSLDAESSLRLFYPKDSFCPFDEEKTIPRGTNISSEWIDSARIKGGATAMLARYQSEAIGTQLPSRALWNALVGYHPDAVWVHEYSPYTLTGMLFAKAHRVPVVVSSDVGRGNRDSFPWVVRLWHRLWSHLADGIIACTPAARDPLCGTPVPFVEAYHAADSRVFVPPAGGRLRENDNTHFVFVGRVIPVKGIDLLLAAAARLKQTGRARWSLRLIGPDVDGYGAALIERFGLKNEVQITGFKEGDALRREFSDGDAFVIATRQDTYAAVVHEAACLGLPLIVSQHAGAADALVREGVNGFKIDPADADLFADRMAAMCDKQTRERMAKESRKIGEHFSAHRRGPAVWDWMQQTFAVRA